MNDWGKGGGKRAILVLGRKEKGCLINLWPKLRVLKGSLANVHVWYFAVSNVFIHGGPVCNARGIWVFFPFPRLCTYFDFFPLGENPPSFPPTLCNPLLFSVCQNSFYPQVLNMFFCFAIYLAFPPSKFGHFPLFYPPFFALWGYTCPSVRVV